MQHHNIAVLALAIASFSEVASAAPVSQAAIPTTLKTSSAQAQASGFVEGQTLGGTTRNFFAKEHGKRDFYYSVKQDDGTSRPTRKRDTWTQGTILDYRSGFTQGTVGIAVQAAAFNEIALERDHHRIAGGGNRTLTDSSGDALEQWSKLGLANLQARVSNTTLTAGRQAMDTPMVATIGNRALPSSFQGVSLRSEEFDNLSFDAGIFDRVSPRTEQSLARFTSEYGDRRHTAAHVSVMGATWKPLHSLTTQLYASQVEDLWNQYYFSAAHELGDKASLGLSTALNYYKTRDAGSARLGAIDNDTYSLSLTATHRAHSLTLAYQEVAGNEYFDYLHETNGIFLANSLFSDYNGPNEKSIQIGYALDMSDYGIAGLKLNAYTARGWGIDGTHYKGTGYGDVRAMDGETHYEYSVGATYAVQSGPLKATTIRGTYTTHRASAQQADGNLNELRLVTTIPFNIL